GLFDVALHDGAESVGSAGRGDQCGSRGVGWSIKTLPLRIQTRGILKVGERDLAGALCDGLARQREADGSIRGYGYRLCGGGNSDLRLQRVAVKVHHVSGGIQME